DRRDLFVGVLSDSHWERFCKEFALEELWSDPTLRTNTGRAGQHERLGRHTEELIGSMSFDDANARLERANVPYAPVNTPHDLVTDHHLRTIKFLHEVTAPDGRK